MKPRWLLACLCLVLLPAAAPADETVTIGIVGAASDVVPYLAEKEGFLHEEGLHAEIINFDSGAKMVAPLGAGQLDVGSGAWSAGLFNAVVRGVGIKIVADKATDEAPYDYRTVIIRRPLAEVHAIKSFADFKGRRVGIIAQGAGDNSSLAAALATAGLTVKDVERVYLGFSAQIVALSNGGIDAAFSSEPDATVAVRQGIAVKFAPYSSFYPKQDTGIIMFGANFIEAHRDEARKFVRAYLRALRFYDASLNAAGHISGPNEAVIEKALAALLKVQDPEVLKDMVAPHGNPDGRIDMASLEKDMAFFRSEGDLEGDIDPAKLVDSSFVEEALKELGPYHPSGG